jgi:hypothetical protein
MGSAHVPNCSRSDSRRSRLESRGSSFTFENRGPGHKCTSGDAAPIFLYIVERCNKVRRILRTVTKLSYQFSWRAMRGRRVPGKPVSPRYRTTEQPTINEDRFVPRDFHTSAADFEPLRHCHDGSNKYATYGITASMITRLSTVRLLGKRERAFSLVEIACRVERSMCENGGSSFHGPASS